MKVPRSIQVIQIVQTILILILTITMITVVNKLAVGASSRLTSSPWVSRARAN